MFDLDQDGQVSFSVKRSNPLPTLVELSCRVVEANEAEQADVHLTLMVQPDEIDIGDYIVNVEIREARLCLEPHGCETDPTSKYGQRKNPYAETRKRKVETALKTGVNSTAAAEIVSTGKFDVAGPSLDVEAKANQNRSELKELTVTETEEVESLTMTVEAVGSDQWKVSHGDKRPLRGVYVGDDRLCRLVKQTSPSNRFGATVTTQVRKRDLDIIVEKNKRLLPYPTSKAKLLSILVAKELNDQDHDQGGEFLTFSTTEISDEG